MGIKQVILKIPDNIYQAFINHIKSKFTDIQIKETESNTIDFVEEDSTYQIMHLSEKNLAEDWLSDEDNKWDDVL